MKIIIPALLILFFKAAHGVEEIHGNQELKFTPSGYIGLDFMNIRQADHNGTRYVKNWANSVLGGVTAGFELNNELTGTLTLESRYFNPFPGQATKDLSYRMRYPTIIGEGKFMYNLGGPKNPLISAELGYFHYNYNTSNSNLGDYLFKSQIYPGNIYTDFDFSMAKITGIRIGNSLGGGLFHHDFLFTTEMKTYPKGDYSLSYVADFNLFDILELGGGISLHNILPSNPKVTTPDIPENTWIIIPVQSWTDSAGVQHYLDVPVSGIEGTLQGSIRNLDRYRQDSLGLPPIRDSVLNSAGEIHPGLTYTKTVFSFAGTMLMGHAAVSPVNLLGMQNYFSVHDMKLYAEIAVLGLKNYEGLYPELMDRVPMMAGITIPPPIGVIGALTGAWKFREWDLMAFEIEYYENPYPNNYQYVFKSGLPHPGGSTDIVENLAKEDFTEDNWKWSLYARRKIIPGFSIVAQVARDHLRLGDMNDSDYQSIIKHRTDWYYVIRTIATF